MQRHESYKPSGVKWIGDVPAHWDVRPGFTCFDENKDRNKRLTEKTVLSLSYGRIIVKSEEKMTGLVPESFDTYQLIKPGDIVIRTTDLQNDKTSLRVGLAKDKGMITSAYLGLRCKPEINPEYVFRLLESYDALKVFYGMGSGLRQNIDFWDFKRLPIPLPPRAEQDRMVTFLDQRTAEIDTAIAKKDRQIELLKEQQNILVGRAATQGLDLATDALPKKGFESGPSPSHWKKLKLKYCVDLLPGFAFKSTAYTNDETDIPLLRGVNINPGRLNWRETVYWPRSKIEDSSIYFLSTGDLVIGMDRPWVAGGIRVAAISSENLPCLLLQRVARLRAKAEVTQGYLELILTSKSFLSYFEPMLTGISVPHISHDQIGNFEARLPPLDEQEAICGHVSNIKTTYKMAIAHESKTLESLIELKSTLVSEVVTGKIKL